MQRVTEREWMDDANVDPALLRKSLAYIRCLNRLLRYTDATLSHLSTLSSGTPTKSPLQILDVATGSADVPRAICRWARIHNRDVRIVALDIHQQTILEAARQTRGLAGVRLAQGDATLLPFADQSFEFVLCSMFFHHLSEEQVITVLREMDRVARRGIIVADLLRDRRAFWWIQLFSCLANPVVRHDALASVRQAFTREEILNLARKAGVGYLTYHQHFAHRFVLSGQKKR